MLNVSTDHPPSLLIQTEDDGVHCENSIHYYLALKSAKAPPSELHVYPDRNHQAQHGYGRCMFPPIADNEVCGWTRNARVFLQRLGVAAGGNFTSAAPSSATSATGVKTKPANSGTRAEQQQHKSQAVTISNVLPRLDQHGKILELGDGSIAKFGDRYYMYGVRYVCTPSPHTPKFFGCPKKDRRIWGNMSIGVASSADMVTWRVESYDIIPEMHDPGAVYPVKDYAYFMPTIVHNPKTGRYALWYYVDKMARGVAVSESSPVGPFKIVHACVPNLQLGSDFFFWTASDGDIYMKHNGGCDGSV